MEFLHENLSVLFLLAHSPLQAARTSSESTDVTPPDTVLQSELKRISEEIIEGIRVGNKELLERHLAADMLLINRDRKERETDSISLKWKQSTSLKRTHKGKPRRLCFEETGLIFGFGG
jgi:hypothetical protein